MATDHSRHRNPNALDDLLGQLVGELALKPTIEPELEPEPEPERPPIAVAPVFDHVPVQPAAPRRNVATPIAIGGGIAVAGVAIAMAMILRPAEPPQSVGQQAAVAAASLAAAPEPPPASPAAAPVAPASGTLVAAQSVKTEGTGLTGQPVDSAPSAPPTPAVGDATPAATDAKTPARKPPKPPGTKKKPDPGKTKVVDPFAD